MRRPFSRLSTGVAAVGLFFILPAILVAQDGESPAPTGTPALEALAEHATRAVVLIDVRTAADTRQGSGILIDPSGLILTNYHVIRDARSARVKLSSGDVYDQVSVLAEDTRRDIAIIQIAGFDLPTLPLGNSDSVRIGSTVVLIGSPLGLENTVSTGIVSGRRQEPEGYQLLQLTAPASQGSSGGAVLSGEGQIIGIAVSQLLAGQNLNFAVPVNYARGLLQNIAGAPLQVLQPMSAPAGATGESPVPTAGTAQSNRNLTYDLEGWTGYTVESREDLGNDRVRRTRESYRSIETVGGGPRRVERYFESETVQVTEPFGTSETIRRERVRSLVTMSGLRPISSHGEVNWLTSQGWQEAQYQVRFDDDHAVGLVTDTTGHSAEIDRVVPRGLLLREMGDLAFATLDVDSLVGRSVEVEMFDPWSGDTMSDRYDVLALDSIRVADKLRDVFRVNVARGLSNETVYFERARPRIAVRRERQDGAGVAQATRIDVTGRPPG